VRPIQKTKNVPSYCISLVWRERYTFAANGNKLKVLHQNLMHSLNDFAPGDGDAAGFYGAR
jgi:hypothetical protein